jgi:hypothetical protein
MQDKILNKIIAADDLHWCSEDNRYVAISVDELNTLLTNSVESGITDENDLYQIVKWATNARIGEILLKNFMERKIKIFKIDENGEPMFGSN